MNGYKDARREKYFNKSQWEGIEYIGLRRGIEVPSLNAAGYKYSGVGVKPNDPIMWMNAAEIAFLRAEATAVFGFDMGGTAEEFYNQAYAFLSNNGVQKELKHTLQTKARFRTHTKILSEPTTI
ncbi:hypothetical protein JCM10003_25 [Bacteroides pyogenes JCM 10003]|nr:hypothetical protein JCM10003_25 [Bacteroides pyogenes JCM 10003]